MIELNNLDAIEDWHERHLPKEDAALCMLSFVGATGALAIAEAQIEQSPAELELYEEFAIAAADTFIKLVQLCALRDIDLEEAVTQRLQRLFSKDPENTQTAEMNLCPSCEQARDLQQDALKYGDQVDESARRAVPPRLKSLHDRCQGCSCLHQVDPRFQVVQP